MKCSFRNTKEDLVIVNEAPKRGFYRVAPYNKYLVDGKTPNIFLKVSGTLLLNLATGLQMPVRADEMIMPISAKVTMGRKTVKAYPHDLKYGDVFRYNTKFYIKNNYMGVSYYCVSDDYMTPNAHIFEYAEDCLAYPDAMIKIG